ncbi:hypothetical protein JOD02_000205 [Caldicoprobacter guelmensis]|uniref:flagellar hook-length control protein FliK n=1 Tax=Caldicoprobacter guelmensis TaxID=1170224 RepID=UPI00195A6DB1|nr:hypothetical protein [Caldicoprobacter guelmensis]
MDVSAVCGIAQSDVIEGNDKLKERRSCAVHEEGWGSQFALILQSFMPFQAAYSCETSGRQESQGSEMPLLDNMPSALQALSRYASWESILAVLKEQRSLVGPQIPNNEAFEEFSEALQKSILPGYQNALPSHQVHSAFERIDDHGGIPDQGTSPLYSAGDKVFDDGPSADWGMHAASDVFAHEGELEVKGTLASGVRAYYGLRYIVEEATDAQLAMVLKKDGDAIGSYSQLLDALGRAVLKDQSLKDKSVFTGSKQHIENVELEWSVIGVDGRGETMNNSNNSTGDLGDAKGDLHLNFSIGHEGHAGEGLYAVGHLQAIYSDEMNPVFDEKLINLHRALEEIADRVRVLLSERRSEVEVRLKPPELGKMVVNVAMTNGTLAVRITVESHAVKDFIQAHVQELKMLLAQEGYALVDIDVNMDQGYQQPQHGGVGNGWDFGNPVSRKTKVSVSGMQQSAVRPSAYYHGYHSFDCLA